MSGDATITLKGRIAQAIFGAATGVIYGAVIAIVAYAIDERDPGAIIITSALVFLVLGFFFGNFIFDALFALFYFVFGVLIGLSDQWEGLRREHNPRGIMRAFLLLGFGTGLVLIFSAW